MALLEDPNACAVCDCPVRGSVGGVPVFFCPEHFKEWKEQILAGEPWVTEMIRLERIRRKRRNSLLKGGQLPVVISTLDVALLMVAE